LHVAKDSPYVENVYVMKKSSPIPAILFVIITAVSVFAQQITDVNMRASKKDGNLRIVFEAEEAFLKKTNTSVSGTSLNIEFPSVFNIASKKGIGVDVSAKERVLTVNMKEPFDIKVLKLTSPARLVIDILPKKAPADAKALPNIELAHKIYVIDPGHGGYNFGITSEEFKEKDIALSIAREIEGVLSKKGKKVFLTRKGDQFMPIKDRAVFANQKAAEIFLSIHLSSGKGFVLHIPRMNESNDSAEALYALSARQRNYSQKSRALADALSKAMKEEFKLNVAQREMALPILDSIAAPAVLIEIPSFKSMNYDQDTRSRLAEAIIKGFSYYGE